VSYTPRILRPQAPLQAQVELRVDHARPRFMTKSLKTVSTTFTSGPVHGAVCGDDRPDRRCWKGRPRRRGRQDIRCERRTIDAGSRLAALDLERGRLSVTTQRTTDTDYRITTKAPKGSRRRTEVIVRPRGIPATGASAWVMTPWTGFVR